MKGKKDGPLGLSGSEDAGFTASLAQDDVSEFLRDVVHGALALPGKFRHAQKAMREAVQNLKSNL